MGPPTVSAGVGVTAARLLTPSLIEPSAQFSKWPLACRLWPGGWLGPLLPWMVRVPGAVWGRVVILQAELAAWNCPRSTCKGFTVKSGVCHRPVEVLPRQSLSPELAVVHYPPTRLIIPLSPHYLSLVGK